MINAFGELCETLKHYNSLKYQIIDAENFSQMDADLIAD
jgi:hypothetical protein